MHRRFRRAVHLAGRVGSLVSLAALVLLGTAVASGLSPTDQRPTITVTYDLQHRH